MTTLSVALLQLASVGADPEQAWKQGELACRHAAERGADVALLPEMWQIGYAFAPEDEEGRAEWLGRATPLGGEYTGRYRSLARELGIAIVTTYLERTEGGARNAATLIDRHGEVAVHYSKVHTCDFGMESALQPGEGFGVAALDTAAGPVSVGLMICYDREFPESARSLMVRGAEIILTPNSCYLSDDRIGQFRARAFENMVGMAMTNYAAPDPTSISYDACNGRSVAFTGICFDDEGTPLDQLIWEGGAEPTIEVVRFDLNALRAYRREETWGDAYRKPKAYEALVDSAPRVPEFERHDSRRDGA